jgi:hypothetical protein
MVTLSSSNFLLFGNLKVHKIPMDLIVSQINLIFEVLAAVEKPHGVTTKKTIIDRLILS